jgi:hypothetical protein
MKLQQKNLPATLIHIDNQGAKAIAENPINKQRSKHIDIKYHFTREKISNGTVKLQYIHTGQNAADCLTKAVTKQTLDTAKPILFGS